MFVCVCFVCVRACVHVCACVRVCVGGRVHVHKHLSVILLWCTSVSIHLTCYHNDFVKHLKFCLSCVLSIGVMSMHYLVSPHATYVYRYMHTNRGSHNVYIEYITLTGCSSKGQLTTRDVRTIILYVSACRLYQKASNARNVLCTCMHVCL